MLVSKVHKKAAFGSIYDPFAAQYLMRGETWMKYGVKCQITIAILIMLTFSLLVCAEEGLPNMRLRLEMEV